MPGSLDTALQPGSIDTAGEVGGGGGGGGGNAGALLWTASTGALAGSAEGGTVTFYLSDPGPGLVAAVDPGDFASSIPVQYVSSARRVQALNARAQNNTSALDAVITLLKNGVATAQTVTIPAGTDGTFRDLSHPIDFADGDYYDVRVVFTGADTGQIASLSVTLEGPAGGGGGGGGGNVTSLDHSIIVAGAGTKDLSWNGVYQLVDSYGVVNDSPAINAALAALAARPHNNGVLEFPAGSHELASQVSVPTGCSMIAAGKNATTLRVTGNGFDAIQCLDTWGTTLKGFTMTAAAPRTSGVAIRLRGGNPAIQPFAPTYTLSAAESVVEEVDMDQQFDGIVIDNDPGPPVRSSFLTYVRGCRLGRMNGGDGIRIDCAAPSNSFQYGASQFLERVAIYGTAGDVNTNGLHIVGTGDATIEKVQTFNVNNGLFINTPAGGRLSTLRFARCQFDTSTAFCVLIESDVSNTTSGDIDFNSCWFAGGGTHNFLVNAPGFNAMRIHDSFFFAATQYGLVLTAASSPPSRVDVVGCQFAGAGNGGFRAVSASLFSLIACRFFPGNMGLPLGMPVGITVDLGCSKFIITGCDTSEATTGISDSSGAVSKVIANNL